MGKSPAKWIKTVLFGKKSSKSNVPKGRLEKFLNETPEVGVGAGAGAGAGAVSLPTSQPHVSPLPVLSHPLPTTSSPLHNDNSLLLLEGTTHTQTQTHHHADSTTPNHASYYHPHHHNAATKAQAAFRGYLARRAFKALKGIIRLQALIRAHLVRRQAVATLYCLLGIVKLQALVRGRKVRMSAIGLQLQKHSNIRSPVFLDSAGVNKLMCTAKLSSNAFVRKILASSPAVIPLHLHYDPEEPNSVPYWLECWSASHFWKPVLLPKKVSDSKPQRKQWNGPPVEPDTGRPKRSVRRIPAANLESNTIQSTSELEKPKRSLRKSSSHPAEPMPENPQNELEKVKRNLRKVHNPVVENAVQQEAETEKPRQSLEKVSSGHDMSTSAEKMKKEAISSERRMSNSREKLKKETDLTECGMSSSGEKMSLMVNKDTPLTVPKLSEPETNIDLKTNEDLDFPFANEVVESKPLMEICSKDENILEIDGELNYKDDLTSSEHLKSNKKATTPAKQEHSENGHQLSPVVPSYMAATESAKAKLRMQGSPRSGQDAPQKGNSTRRHSLPSPANGKMSSQSPRTQRLVNAGGKGENKNDKSLASSKDGNGTSYLIS
ncbi:hypothetical protein ACFE04_024512 [Oxalis oulophora]